MTRPAERRPCAGSLCLVTGATGYVGGRLVPELIAAGYRVRIIARHPQGLHDRPWSDQVDIVAADASDPNGVRRALEGVDVAYYLIHALGTADFERTDRDTARTFAAAARDANVARLVYLGGLVPAAVPTSELSPHLRSRDEVASLLLDSGVPTAALRAAVILGSGSVSFEMLRYLTERLPAMITPRWVNVRASSRSPSGTCCATWSVVPRTSIRLTCQPQLRHRRPRRADVRGDDAALCPRRRAASGG
jgi:uncharacterized protein YbjT (DUF2867 family)